MESKERQIRVQLDFPVDILGALDVTQSQLAARMKELIVLELFRERQISSGKAAELLGVTKYQFVLVAAQHDIPYLDQSADDLTADATAAQQAGRPRKA